MRNTAQNGSDSDLFLSANHHDSDVVYWRRCVNKRRRDCGRRSRDC